MDRTEIVKHLAQAERDVAEAATNVERQRKLVEEQQGRDNEAFSEMISLEERLALLTKDRDWFLRTLETNRE